MVFGTVENTVPSVFSVELTDQVYVNSGFATPEIFVTVTVAVSFSLIVAVPGPVRLRTNDPAPSIPTTPSGIVFVNVSLFGSFVTVICILTSLPATSDGMLRGVVGLPMDEPSRNHS